MYKSQSVLDDGADDYFHMSYPPAEITSRLRAVQRRRLIDSEGMARSSLIKVNQPSLRFYFCGWNLDCGKSELYNPDGIQVPLTNGEYRILSRLASSQGRVQTRQALTYALKGDKSGRYHRTADTAISRLRRKLLKYCSDELIRLVPREGYKLVVAATHISDE
jgi:DNA-binding response OmpR family regulator